MLKRLEELYFHLNVAKDPYVVRLNQNLNVVDAEELESARNQLTKVLTSGKTYCSEQIKTLYNRAVEIYAEVGGETTDWYISECVSRFEMVARGDNGDLIDELWDWTSEEKEYLQDLFRSAELSNPVDKRPHDTQQYSPKMEALLTILRSESRPDFTGIVFVQQRATAAALAHALSSSPTIAAELRTAVFVGTSTSSARKAKIAELPLPSASELGRRGAKTLEAFRTGELNLIVCTSVLEEGIDVSTCDVVVCHDPPANLKAFVQRRGRARRRESRFYIVSPATGPGQIGQDKWRDLEDKMIAVYLDDERKVKEAEEREAEEEELHDRFEIESTGSVPRLPAIQIFYFFLPGLLTNIYVVLC